MNSMVQNFNKKEDKIPMDELIENYRSMKIKKVTSYESVNEEKFLTKPGHKKILFSISDSVNNRFLSYETKYASNRCRFAQENANFYLIKIPSHPEAFAQEDFYQIVYSTENPGIHDKYEGDKFDLFRIEFNNKGSLLRIRKIEGEEDVYDIQDVATGKYLEDYDNKSYGFHQPSICRNEENRIKWKFDFPVIQTEAEKLGYDEDLWDEL